VEWGRHCRPGGSSSGWLGQGRRRKEVVELEGLAFHDACEQEKGKEEERQQRWC
jgi:hypothetical protein